MRHRWDPGSRIANDLRVTDVVAGGCAGICIILKIILIKGGILNAVYRISEVFDMQKAKKHLEELGVSFEDRHIVEENPTKEELTEWISVSGYPVKKFFNTSGMKYRELGLKDRLPQMTDEEKIELLATDGMLVKRPLLIDGDRILAGFKEAEWTF